jgi:hypothetical protein
MTLPIYVYASDDDNDHGNNNNDSNNRIENNTKVIREAIEDSIMSLYARMT